MVCPDGRTVVDPVPELLDENFLQILVRTVNDCATTNKVLVRNALRSLADISKMESAKPHLISYRIVDALKQYLQLTAANVKTTATKETFSYAACCLTLNIMSNDTIDDMIRLDYPTNLLSLVGSSLRERPGVAVFALTVLKSIAQQSFGAQHILRIAGLGNLQQSLSRAIQALGQPQPADIREDFLMAVRCVCSVMLTLCNQPDRLDIPSFFLISNLHI